MLNIFYRDGRFAKMLCRSLLSRLVQFHGVCREDAHNRQMVDILNAVLTDGLPAVEAACAEALGHGVHSADVVLNILARQREPAPPANIMTPAALTLRHAPIADCARYDNLRRTI